MNHYRVTLSYKGTHYLGWQIQPEGRTVQGELNRALGIIAKSDQVRSIGSGRTDAGVHARGQVARLDIPFFIDPMGLMRGLNSHLPDDIRILNCAVSHDNFHPTFQAEAKQYSYFFQLRSDAHPLVGELLAHNPHHFDLTLAQAACQCFVGTHDFANFYTQGTEVSSTLRTIHSCEMIPFSPGPGLFDAVGEYYEIRIWGNGFLKQMVRMMVGTIWNAARKKITTNDITRALEGKPMQRLAPVAPSEGLYLMRVVYPQN